MRPMKTAFGTSLKHWRSIRRISQLELSQIVGMSARHLSFLETGRSRPRQEIVLRLAEALSIPLRERNELLLSAGLPSHYPKSEMSAAGLEPFQRIVGQILEQHAPYPGFVLDRWWNMTEANEPATQLFLAGRSLKWSPLNILDWLTQPYVRELIVNWEEALWSGVHRLRREVQESGDDSRLTELLGRAMQLVKDVPMPSPEYWGLPVLCTRLRIPKVCGRYRELSVVSTVARFGTTREITCDELRVELIFPADDETRSFFEESCP